MIINLIFLVMTIVVFVALIPVLRDMMNNARDQTGLNCKSDINKCTTVGSTINDDEVPCYNKSQSSETVACTLIDLYIPYIVIVVLLAGVAKIMANRVEQLGFGGQPAYPGY
jgi:hypothetical protein